MLPPTLHPQAKQRWPPVVPVNLVSASLGYVALWSFIADKPFHSLPGLVMLPCTCAEPWVELRMQECNRREKALVAGNGCMHSPTNMPFFWPTLLLPGPAGRLPQTCTPNNRPSQRQSVLSGAAHSYGTLEEIEKERTTAKRNRNTVRADVHAKEIRKGHHYSPHLPGHTTASPIPASFIFPRSIRWFP